MCGDEGDRCIFGEALFVAEEVVGVTFLLLSFSTESWKGGSGRWRLVDGLCLLPIKPLLRLGRLGCQALIWFQSSYWPVSLSFVICYPHQGPFQGGHCAPPPKGSLWSPWPLAGKGVFRLQAKVNWWSIRLLFSLSHKLYKTQSSQFPSSDNDDAATAEVMKWYFWIELSIGIH